MHDPKPSTVKHGNPIQPSVPTTGQTILSVRSQHSPHILRLMARGTFTFTTRQK
ncbi:hypothetical protein BC834DRAFT_904444, partial [Gloeopeniophorella convolvens]